MVGHILYNPDDGNVKFTQAREGAGTGKWEKFIEDGYLPIAKITGRDIRVEPLNIPVVKLSIGSQIDNSEINEEKKIKNMKKIKLNEKDLERIVKKTIKEQADTTEDDIERLADRAAELEFQAEQLESDISEYIDDLEMEITEFQSHHDEDDGNLTEALERAYQAAADADKSGDELDMVIYFLESYMDDPGNYWGNTGPREINEDFGGPTTREKDMLMGNLMRLIKDILIRDYYTPEELEMKIFKQLQIYGEQYRKHQSQKRW